MATASTPVKAAIFDIGATLVTGPPVAPNKVIAGLMNDVTAAEVASVIMTSDLCTADSVREALVERFGKLDEAAITGICELWNAQATAPQAIDGACEAVLSLHRRGIRIGLLSDIWNPYYAGVEMALPDVIDCAEAIVLSCRTGARKPSQDNFARVLADLTVDPSEAVMIGDTYSHDILPALEMGMQAIWVLARPDREAESIIRILNGERPRPTATVSHISEVPRLDLWPESLPTF